MINIILELKLLNNGWKTYWKNPGDAGSSIKIEI